LINGWKWNPEQHFLEQAYGSLLLIDFMRSSKDGNWVDRVDPSFRAAALHACHAEQRAWVDHGNWLGETLKLLASAQAFHGLPSVHLEYSSREPNLPGDVYLSQEPSETIRFIRPESTWGVHVSTDACQSINLSLWDHVRDLGWGGRNDHPPKRLQHSVDDKGANVSLKGSLQSGVLALRICEGSTNSSDLRFEDPFVVASNPPKCNSEVVS
jgi:hypothetical protein